MHHLQYYYLHGSCIIQMHHLQYCYLHGSCIIHAGCVTVTMMPDKVIYPNSLNVDYVICLMQLDICMLYALVSPKSVNIIDYDDCMPMDIVWCLNIKTSCNIP